MSDRYNRAGLTEIKLKIRFSLTIAKSFPHLNLFFKPFNSPTFLMITSSLIFFPSTSYLHSSKYFRQIHTSRCKAWIGERHVCDIVALRDVVEQEGALNQQRHYENWKLLAYFGPHLQPSHVRCPHSIQRPLLYRMQKCDVANTRLGEHMAVARLLTMFPSNVILDNHITILLLGRNELVNFIHFRSHVFWTFAVAFWCCWILESVFSISLCSERSVSKQRERRID